jgi:hypothetical protein
MATKKHMSKGAAAKSIAKKEGMSVKQAKGILAWATKTHNGKDTTGHGNRWKGNKKK